MAKSPRIQNNADHPVVDALSFLNCRKQNSDLDPHIDKILTNKQVDEMFYNLLLNMPNIENSSPATLT
jgi:hypothetical protein